MKLSPGFRRTLKPANGGDGRLLGMLERGPMPAGAHVLIWKGAGRAGSGVTLLRFQAGASAVTFPTTLLPSW